MNRAAWILIVLVLLAATGAPLWGASSRGGPAPKEAFRPPLLDPPPPLRPLEAVRPLQQRTVPGTSRLHRTLTRLRVVNVIYTNSVQDQFSQAEIATLSDEITEAETFFFRHSHSTLDFDSQILVIDRFLGLDQFWLLSPPGGYWLPQWSIDGTHSVEQDLRAAGYADGDLAGVFVWYAWENTESAYAALGGGTYGVGAILGTAAYSSVPLCWIATTNDWFFLHEFHHQLDSMFDASGYPQYPHADRPGDYAGHYDEGYSFNAWILGSCPVANWAGLVAPWASHPVFVDSDGDGLVDQAAGLPWTEKSLGGDPYRSDTDSDGLPDGEEVSVGLFAGSNLQVADTDGDGILDGWDDYPLDAVSRAIRRGTPVIDGVIGSSEWGPISRLRHYPGTSDLAADLYARWDADYLCLALHVDDDSVETPWADPWWDDGMLIQLDAGNDGFLAHGQDNYELWATPQGDGARPTFVVRIQMPDGSMNEELVLETDLLGAYARSANDYTLEVGIPMNPATGLQLLEGDSLGIQVEVVDFDTYPGWPHLQLFSRFVDLPLADQLTDVAGASPSRVVLAQNVPNPFNPSTRIRFELLQPERVQLQVYDARGRLIRTLVDERMPAGSHWATWDGTNAGGYVQPSGVYVYRLSAGRLTQSRRLTLVR